MGPTTAHPANMILLGINRVYFSIFSLLFPIRALMGAGLFIITVVIGTILMVSPTKSYNISKTRANKDVQL